MLDDMVAKDQQAARNGMYGAYQRRVVQSLDRTVKATQQFNYYYHDI